MGAGTDLVTNIEAATTAGVDAVVRIDSGTISTSPAVYSFSEDRMTFDMFFESADHSKVIHVFGGAFDDTATLACSGVISAEVLK